MLNADCNILVPQIVRGEFFSGEDAKEFYIETCYELLCEIIEKVDIDKNRIYTYGCSLGGGLVWNMLANHCDLIAGAAEWTGCYYGYRKFENTDFEAMTKNTTLDGSFN